MTISAKEVCEVLNDAVEPQKLVTLNLFNEFNRDRTNNKNNPLFSVANDIFSDDIDYLDDKGIYVVIDNTKDSDDLK